MLWFAWKIVLLQYRKQPYQADYTPFHSCDLLEKSYFCSIANNWLSLFPCRQSLWFAWKIVLLQYRKQQLIICGSVGFGCDLLEKSYFCSIANNMNGNIEIKEWVVICLKNRTFAVSQTTALGLYTDYIVLWFAWKIVLLQYRKQPCNSFGVSPTCCDLLEKSYFCSIANNYNR